MFPGHNQFQRAAPFRHLVIDNALATDELVVLNDSWPKFAGWRESKSGLRHTSRLPTGPVADRLVRHSFVKTLERISGIDGLMADERWDYGGLFEDFETAREKVHVGPTVHPRCPELARRLCVILYVTPTDQLTGELELWQARDWAPWRRSLLIGARYNRMVVFETTIDSWHGHASPLMWGSLTRRYVKAYYYSPYRPEGHIEQRKTVTALWT